jgi:hypothetical protein
MPLKPTIPGTDRPKKDDEFSDPEKADWIVQSGRELAGGVFGVAAPLGLVDVANLRRCLQFFDELPPEWRTGEVVGAVDDLRELLTRVPQRPPVRARA